MIVVTGGAGFIGSNLVAALNDRGQGDIVIIDWLMSGKPCHFQSVVANINDQKWRNLAKREFIKVITPDQTWEFLENHKTDIETVFHLGAISTTTETDADLINQWNINYSLKLADWCHELNVQFIYASSAATYGDGTKGFSDDADLSSLANLRPLNLYGWSKHQIDRRLARLGRLTNQTGKIDSLRKGTAGIKFFNVFGPNEYHKGGQRSTVSQFYDQLSSGKKMRLFKSDNPNYSDGGQLRDFVWIEDCVALLLILQSKPSICGLFNCGSGKARTFLDLATVLFNAYKNPSQNSSQNPPLAAQSFIEWIDLPESLKGKYQYFTEASLQNLRNHQIALPITNLEAAVTSYVTNYLSQPDPYR